MTNLNTMLSEEEPMLRQGMLMRSEVGFMMDKDNTMTNLNTMLNFINCDDKF